MEIRDYLRPEFIDPDFSGRTKEEVLTKIAELAAMSDKLTDTNAADIAKALTDREEIGSTGFGNGIAIPHTRLQNIKGFVVGIILSKKGIDFDAVDGRKVKLFVFIIGPEEKRTEHIHILSSISRILKTDEARKSIMNAATSDEVIAKFLSYANPESRDFEMTKPRCLFSVFVQRQEYFSDILELFSAEVPGEITVIEGANAGRYLHTMPLFAGYWNERPSNFNRLILAVVDKSIMNDVVRRIQTILDSDNNGIHIAVQDLLYSWGHLDF